MSATMNGHHHHMNGTKPLTQAENGNPAPAKAEVKESYPLQVPLEVLNTSNPESLNMFGDWCHDPKNVAKLQNFFTNADPFPYVIIPNFFNQEVAERIEQEFPLPTSDCWFRYNNPIEIKLAMNHLNKLPAYMQQIFYNLASPETVKLMTDLTGIPKLEADPYLHGGGAHGHPRGGKLDMHLDYSIHPISGKERRVNLIVYLNRDWTPEYGGGLQLWDKELKECKVTAPINFNVAVMFRTSDESFHGLPDPLKCPDNMMRKSLAVYYVTDPRSDATHRYKAQFFARPSDPKSEFMDRLRAIRPMRRLEAADLEGWDAEKERLNKLGFDI